MTVTLSIQQALFEATQTLTMAGVPEARKEARSLLAHVLEVHATRLIANSEDQVSESLLKRFRELVDRRANGEPAQYITGCQDFYGRRFEVNPDVLIPRPETEWLVENALSRIPSAESTFSICDVGTGSGCIAITIVCERPRVRAVALDVSEAALEVAKRNAESLGVADRITFVKSDCFSALPVGTQFDLVISNPPYVAANVLPGLQREVRDHEPLLALSPGEDGLTIIRRLLIAAPRFLRPEGHLFMEIGFDQGEGVKNLVDTTVWQFMSIIPDLQQIPRIVVLKKLPATRC